MHRREPGFTLLEVLVAGFILFLTVSTASMVFGGAIKSKVAAQNTVSTYGYAPMLAEHVLVELRMGERSGSGKFLDVDYTWQATQIRSAAIVEVVDPGATPSATGRQARLWSISLKLTGQRTETFQFEATSW